MAPQTKNLVNALRLNVIEQIARAFWSGSLAEQVDRIPFLIRPRDSAVLSRCCIYKDRAILRQRIIAALGFRLEDEEDDSTPLRTYVEQAKERRKPSWPILTVCEIACHSCVRARYYVTDVCQGCVAHSCAGACRFGAISFLNGRSHIDADKCRNCGQCQEACPYQAVVRLNVPCEEACPVRAMRKNEQGRAEIDFDKCTSCGRCMRACPFGAVIERSEVLEVLLALQGKKHVTALIAPAIAGQFAGGPARIVTALLQLGFDSVLEVAAGADITSEREAHEFVERMEQGDSFMTTSCCPAYVEAVRRHVPELLPHVSSTATPMHYSAELARKANPETVTVFIGPCVAKRLEGLHDELVDYVLTFEEVEALFAAKEIDVAACEEHPLGDGASSHGRGYAITGGVSSAVRHVVGNRFEVKPISVNGLSPKELKTLQSYAKNGCPGNLVEVMTCVGGCVGGAGTLAQPGKAAKAVENFARNGKA